MRTYADGLRANSNIRLIMTRNDILLTTEDLEWIEATFEPDRLKIFESGGHLGNLANPAAQKAVLDALGDLKPRR